MQENIPDFNDVLKEIQEQERAKMPTQSEPYPEPITDENVNDYILDRGSKLVEDSLEAVKRLKDRITAAHDPDELAALSQLIRATTGALGTLTAISIQNKKDKVSKENTSTKQLATKTVNNTVLIGTREEAMKKFLEVTKDMQSADVESVTDAPYVEETLDE
jgi:hypothetical protein